MLYQIILWNFIVEYIQLLYKTLNFCYNFIEMGELKW